MGDHRHRPRQAPQRFHPPAGAAAQPAAFARSITATNTRRRPRSWPTATAAAANEPGWRVRVVPNKFPVLGIEGELNRQGEGMYDKMNGIGAHEVIIETPDHTADLGRHAGAPDRRGAVGLSRTASTT